MAKYVKSWTVAATKAHLSQVINEALLSGPQLVTRNGVNTVVIMSAAEWEKQTKRKGTLADFLAASPLKNSGLIINRRKDKLRSVAL